MAFETPITIKEAVENIHSRKYLLPAIQREFVWSTDQIEVLFDSLMRDYPIGSFLFWYVSRENTGDYEFYEFIREYSELNARHNPKANINGNEDIITVLDGQQRLTALYIGLKGSYAYKLPRKRAGNPSAYPKRKLYLNLRGISELSNREYEFQFLTFEESQSKDESTYWFEVGKILDFEEFEVNEYLLQNDVMTGNKSTSMFANRTLFRLHSIIHKNPVINYYLERSKELDKVLNIFIRINNGGTRLNYTDLLLSIATAQWQARDAREEITNFVDVINQYGDGFNFDKDFILKACLVLCDFSNIAFKIDNFKKENMLTIEGKWDEVSNAIQAAVMLVSSFGYNRETLTSHNSIIPIAYFLMKLNCLTSFDQSSKHKENRSLIKNWLAKALLKRVFGAHPENVYRAMREVISSEPNLELFPLSKILEKFKGTEKSILFTDDDIENLFLYKYGQPYTFSALSVLYPTLDYRNKFHIDHIFPKSLFKPNILNKKNIDPLDFEFYLDNFNNLANLQLMEGIPNQEKSDLDFKEWLLKTYPNDHERKEYMKKNYIPENIELGLDNFEEFIKERQKLMKSEFERILK
jgi:uncharacterized protein with ParB-like and HNH nuclease domain